MAEGAERSPRVLAVSWGRMEVEAVRIYNDLTAGHPVGGLFHSTC